MVALKIDPAFIRKNGIRQKIVNLPEIKPRFHSSFCLIAIVGSGNSQDAINVTTDAAYAEMYGHATTTGNPHTVELYTILEEFLD